MDRNMPMHGFLCVLSKFFPSGNTIVIFLVLDVTAERVEFWELWLCREIFHVLLLQTDWRVMLFKVVIKSHFRHKLQWLWSLFSHSCLSSPLPIALDSLSNPVLLIFLSRLTYSICVFLGLALSPTLLGFSLAFGPPPPPLPLPF